MIQVCDVFIGVLTSLQDKCVRERYERHYDEYK